MQAETQQAFINNLNHTNMNKKHMENRDHVTFLFFALKAYRLENEKVHIAHCISTMHEVYCQMFPNAVKIEKEEDKTLGILKEGAGLTPQETHIPMKEIQLLMDTALQMTKKEVTTIQLFLMKFITKHDNLPDSEFRTLIKKISRLDEEWNALKEARKSGQAFFVMGNYIEGDQINHYRKEDE